MLSVNRCVTDEERTMLLVTGVVMIVTYRGEVQPMLLLTTTWCVLKGDDDNKKEDFYSTCLLHKVDGRAGCLR